MRTKILTSAVLVALTAGLTGCGGGGGGGSVPPVAEVPFTSFAAVQPNQTVVMPGISQTASGTEETWDTSHTVTSATLAPVDTASSTLKLTYDPSLALSAVSVSTPYSSVSISKAAGDSIDCTTSACYAANSTGSVEAIVINGKAAGWNYQTFGIWDRADTLTTWQSGAISAGNPTPASAVPLSGVATFTGLSSGFYIDPSGTPYFTAASMTANADFSSRSIGFSTSGTQLVNLNNVSLGADAGLNLSGTLTYSPGTSVFSGSVTTANTALSGSATGQFYGPSAEEIGGTYSLSASSGVSHMLGGFGGKR